MILKFIKDRKSRKIKLRQEQYDDRLRDEAQKQRFKSKMDKLKITTYTKRLVAIIITICLVDLQLSYVLAFMGKDQIAEELSSNICNTILGVAFVYIVRAYFDTRAEKKQESNSTIDMLSDVDISPISNISKKDIPDIIRNIEEHNND